MKGNKWFIIIFAILIVSIIIISLLLMKTNNIEEKNDSKDKNNLEENVLNQEEINQEEIDQKENEKYTNVPPDFSSDVGYDEFYTVTNCMSLYLDTINTSSSSYYSNDSNGKKIQTTSNEQIQKIIKSLTSTKATDNVKTLKEKVIFTPVNIERATEGRVVSYKGYGILSNIDLNYKGDIYFIVNLDTQEKTFSAEILNGNYSNISQIKPVKLDSIAKNDNNTFAYQKVDDQYNYKKLFENIKRLMIIKPEIAYQYLDDDYKAKRFGSYDAFQQYVKNNRDHLIGITPKSFKVDDDSSKIFLRDQYSNWYEFEITGTMKYKVKIDNYIIMFDRDIKEYNEYNDEQKVKYNIRRWIKMLNSKDYKFAYEYLNDEFKKNNYTTLNDFSKFMQSKYPGYYSIESMQVSNEGNTYTAKLELNVDGEEFSDKYMTIIIRLDEDTNFTMSFDAQ